MFWCMLVHKVMQDYYHQQYPPPWHPHRKARSKMILKGVRDLGFIRIGFFLESQVRGRYF